MEEFENQCSGGVIIEDTDDNTSKTDLNPYVFYIYKRGGPATGEKAHIYNCVSLYFEQFSSELPVFNSYSILTLDLDTWNKSSLTYTK